MINHPSHFVIYAWPADNFNCEVVHDATCQLSHLSSEVGKNTRNSKVESDYKYRNHAHCFKVKP